MLLTSQFNCGFYWGGQALWHNSPIDFDGASCILLWTLGTACFAAAEQRGRSGEADRCGSQADVFRAAASPTAKFALQLLAGGIVLAANPVDFATSQTI